MFDIVWGITVLLLLSILALRLGSHFGSSTWTANLTGFSVLLTTFLFLAGVHGQLWLAKYLPVSNIVVLSNFLPVLASVLAGVLRTHPGIPPWRGQAFSLALLIAGWLSVAWTVAPQSLNSRNMFRNGVCIQSTPATCGACSAVTLLGHAGIETNEEEMARLCLTSGRGTNLLGIFRGLQRKTSGTYLRVEVVDSEFDDLTDFPILAAVRQSASTSNSDDFPSTILSKVLRPIFRSSQHCIVIFEITDRGTAIVGDPALLSNPTEIPLNSLRKVWLRQGFRLVGERNESESMKLRRLQSLSTAS